MTSLVELLLREETPMTSQQDLANIIAEFSENLKRLIQAAIEVAVFEATGQPPEDKHSSRPSARTAPTATKKL
jgi:hypothetical protein